MKKIFSGVEGRHEGRISNLEDFTETLLGMIEKHDKRIGDNHTHSWGEFPVADILRLLLRELGLKIARTTWEERDNGMGQWKLVGVKDE